VFFMGRRMERGLDGRWQKLARSVGGQFLGPPFPAWIAHFGPDAPWHAWARNGALQIPRVIDGADAQPPFALVHVRYSVRESRGETESEQWYEVTVAAVRVPQATSTSRGWNLDADLRAALADGTLFVWKPAPRGAGAALRPEELPALLQQARAMATRLSPPAPGGRTAEPAEPARASGRTPS
jgi:hypothetical protein